MKLCHIDKYHDVFFKFDNVLYGTMLYGIITLRCLLSKMNSFDYNSMKLGHILK